MIRPDSFPFPATRFESFQIFWEKPPRWPVAGLIGPPPGSKNN
jgi:hypothetical protein